MARRFTSRFHVFIFTLKRGWTWSVCEWAHVTGADLQLLVKPNQRWSYIKGDRRERERKGREMGEKGTSDPPTNLIKTKTIRLVKSNRSPKCWRSSLGTLLSALSSRPAVTIRLKKKKRDRKKKHHDMVKTWIKVNGDLVVMTQKKAFRCSDKFHVLLLHQLILVIILTLIYLMQTMNSNVCSLSYYTSTYTEALHQLSHLFWQILLWFISIYNQLVNIL